jgi:hypothetical protein
MAHTFPLLNLIVALRAKTKTAFALPDGTKIPVSGDPLVVVSPESLPMSVISFPDGVQIGPGSSLKALNEAMSVDVWYLGETTGGADDTEIIIGKLVALAQSVDTDPTLGGTATDTRITGMDFNGLGERGEGESYTGGRLRMEIVIEDV